MATGRAQKSRDTAIEVRMRAELRALDLRKFLTHKTISLPKWGKRSQRTTPDILFEDARVAVFLDGCWYHGCVQCYRETATNTAYWRKRTADARARDQRHSRALVTMGYRVLRFWEHEDLSAAAKAVRAVIETNPPPGVFGLPV